MLIFACEPISWSTYVVIDILGLFLYPSKDLCVLNLEWAAITLKGYLDEDPKLDRREESENILPVRCNHLRAVVYARQVYLIGAHCTQWNRYDLSRVFAQFTIGWSLVRDVGWSWGEIGATFTFVFSLAHSSGGLLPTMDAPTEQCLLLDGRPINFVVYGSGHKNVCCLTGTLGEASLLIAS